MLALRLQRTGRKGYALYRLIAQDAHRSPTSGKVAAHLGSYDPHAKTFSCDRTKVEFYLEHGAQPSPRVISLLEKEGLKLPDWVRRAPVKKAAIKSPEKLRRNRPAEPAAPADEAPAEAEAPAEETPVEKAPAEPAEAETAPVEAKAEPAPTDD